VDCDAPFRPAASNGAETASAAVARAKSVQEPDPDTIQAAGAVGNGVPRVQRRRGAEVQSPVGGMANARGQNVLNVSVPKALGSRVPKVV
jgi:hypothetical protein